MENDTATTLGTLGTVVFQFDTLGSAIDFDSIRLNYSGGSLAPVNFITEYRIITGGFGGFTNRSAMQWNLTGLGIADYTITFRALGSSSSFNIAQLDAATVYTEAVASARTWTGGAGDGKWSSAGNWSGGTVPSGGGNVTLDPSSSAVIELDGGREVGLLTLSHDGPFNLTPGGGAVLTVNTGITATAAGNSEIAAPIHLGGHNFLTVAPGATLTLSGALTGEALSAPFPRPA